MKSKKNKKQTLLRIESLLLVIVLVFTMAGCSKNNLEHVDGNEPVIEEIYDSTESSEEAVSESNENTKTDTDVKGIDFSDIPEYSGEPYVMLNGGSPFFTSEELEEAYNSYESYGALDSLGRCTACIASVGQDLMPTEERGNIGSVRPTGWHTAKYDCVDGKYLYNRCHLIGYQLTAENANEKNLITGTRYLNIDGMLMFENMIADYVKETNNHVLYRVTPIFVGDELVARGVLMEGSSVEDGGDDILFCVFAYNVQPGVEIDYQTGESCLAGTNKFEDDDEQAETCHWIVNSNTGKFHKEGCSSAKKISNSNRKEIDASRQEMIDQGYSPCGICKP